MKASVSWINRYLSPAGLSAEDVEHLLTFAGFPIDAREDLSGGDARLEVEVTSNRGDVLSHIGLAREVAAKTGRVLKLPEIPQPKTAGAVSEAIALENTVPDACPRFTLQVIRGIKVGPSPAWLASALESVGQRPINNIVDITNFINFEWGQPTHAFDLAKLAGQKLFIRSAREGESLTTLDGKKRTLKEGEIVIADAQRAQSLAGVMGGADSEVSAETRDVVLEVATWDPVAVRRASRRHQLRTDASHRYERTVDPRTLDLPARRAAALIAEVGGGTLLSGMLDQGRPLAPFTEIPFRPNRCNTVLGFDIPLAEVTRILAALDIMSRPQGDMLRCQIPPWRPDLEREIDLIEEIARIKGLDAIPTHPRMTVTVRPPQTTELAVREIGTVLTGLGFYETVTFGFTTPAQSKPFQPAGLSLLAVSDDRRKHEGTLRPSILPSLLAVRKKNQDGGVEVPGGIRFYETGSTFADRPASGGRGPGQLVERRVLALAMDIPGIGKGKPGSIEERQAGLRILRGAIESIARATAGPEATVEIRPAAAPGLDPSAAGDVLINGRPFGHAGLLDPGIQRQFDLAIPMAAAELDLDALIALYPPRSLAHQLPAFPVIERDLSLVVDEATTWSTVRTLVESPRPERLEGVEFVGTYRGKQLGPGKKSLTLRMRFRDPNRTLRHEEVDPQVASVVTRAGEKLGATVRA